MEDAPPALFREIHKHAWLRRLPDRPGNKKLCVWGPERWWVVFCVHGDAAPYLEGYAEAAGAAAHTPRWRAPLGSALHVSGSIRPERGEYEFVVALREGAVRLVAPTRECMQDWVDTLRNKLREMKILSPRDNVYSKAPEQARARAPTRDPTSPLPPPPPGAPPRVPGTEHPRPADAAPTTRSTSRPAETETAEASSSRARGTPQQADKTRAIISNFEVLQATVDNVLRAGSSRTGRADSVTINVNPEQSQTTPQPAEQPSPPHTQLEASNVNVVETVTLVNSDILLNCDETTPAENSSAAHAEKLDGRVDSKHETESAGVVLTTNDEVNVNASCSRNSNVAGSRDGQDVASSMQAGKQWTDTDVLRDLGNTAAQSMQGKHKIHTKQTDRDASKDQWTGQELNITKTKLHVTQDLSETENDEKNWSEIDLFLEQKWKGDLNDNSYLKLSDVSAGDAWVSEASCREPPGEGARSISPRSPSAGTSQLANISGMNVCLSESLPGLGASETAFPEFNNPANSTERVQRFQVENKTKDQYTKVNLNEKIKKIECVKKDHLIAKTCDIATASENNSTPQEERNEKLFQIKSMFDQQMANSEKSTSVTKPKVIPRTVMNVRCSQDLDMVVNINQSNTSVNKPSIVQRKKVFLNRTSSVPDAAATQEILQNHGSHMVQDTSCNVTIISVPANKQQAPSPAAQCPASPKSKDSRLNGRHYVNVVTDGKSEVTLTAASDSQQCVTNNAGKDCEEAASVCLSVGSGYGHIRHSSSTSVGTPVSKHISVDKTEPSQAVVELKADGNLAKTARGHSITKIGHEESQVNNLSKENSPIVRGRRKSESGSSNVSVGERAGEETVTVSGNDGLYESVFTPFTVTKSVGKTETRNPPNEPTNENQLILKINEPSDEGKRRSVQENHHNGSRKMGKTSEAAVPSGSGQQRSQLPRTARGNQYEFLSWIRDEESNPDKAAPDANRKPNKQSAANLSKFKPPNIFTRGITELSIMTKFKNFGHSNVARQPLISQFYAGTDNNVNVVTPAGAAEQSAESAGPSAGLPSKSSGGGGERKAGKLSFFNKLAALKPGGERSSLRRNWSEHNDRTAPLIIKQPSKAPRAGAAPLRPRQENSSQRRRSSSLSNSTLPPESSSPGPVSPSTIHGPGNIGPGRPLGMREQQVCRLRAEMCHVAGVRLRLTPRDLLGDAVALADIMGAVWVCGWRQRLHPLLYTALHIGDQLQRVAGAPVASARQARQAIAQAAHPDKDVELIIKRLPQGQVFTLRRSSDAQELGLVLEGATIVGLCPDSPAARAGVPPQGTLTEVNGRPLNLLLKKGDNQVRKRLSAIGRDVSVLVQPTEFVLQLRSALKAMHKHNLYIVQ